MKRHITIGFLFVFAVAGFFLSQQVSSAKEPAKLKNVTFSRDVAPIFNAKCTECHRPGEAAPFSTLTYKDVRPWAKSIREKVVNREMPPWHADPHVGQFKNDRLLTAAEIATITAWVDGGALEGNPKDLPPVPKFTEGWSIGKPDVVIPIPEEYTYKAGADEYQYFEVPTDFGEDKYVQLAEARPGNRKIVHHIIAFLVPPGSPSMASLLERLKNTSNSPMYRDGFLLRMKMDQPVNDDGCADGGRRGGGGDSILTGYAPGHNADIWEPGTGRLIPKGSIIRFQMHYSNQTMNGNAVEKDRSAIGLVFAKEPPQKLLVTNSVGNMSFRIPAGAENHRVTACRTLKRDTTIYALLPHMHLRGKSMEYRVFYPDGKSEVLLSVPNYDFGWQTNYVLKEPKTLPRGSRIMVTAYFDNSAKNKFNPDPTKDVRYGEPTYDEMMLGFMDFVVHKPAVAQVDPKILDSYTGRYEVMPNVFATVTREGNNLIVQAPLMAKMEFQPESETKFFMTKGEADATFVRNDKGAVEVLLDAGGRMIRAKRVSETTGAAGGGQ